MATHYTKDHEWIRVEDGVAVVGISDYAQQQLGDVVYVELPDVGRRLAKGAEAAVVESVKAASEVYTPIGGEVAEVNGALGDDPALVNRAPESGGWFFKVRGFAAGDLDGLMDANGYRDFVATL